MHEGAGASFPPRGSCDCHVHVIGPKSSYPLSAKRSYTPADAPVAALLQMMGELGLDRAVIIQPSIYGTDNACTLDALDTLGGRGRGVAVIADSIAPSELDAMHRRGVRGVRLNIVSGGAPGLESRGGRDLGPMRQLTTAVARLCARNGWHLQLFLAPDLLVAIEDHLAKLPVELVFDHFAMIRPERPHAEALDALMRLMSKGRAWTKLSGFYRISEDPFDPAIAPLARKLFDANPERVVWGSDWPHTPAHNSQQIEDDREVPYRDMDTKRLLTELGVWFPEPGDLNRILVENPAKLYDFQSLD